MREGAHSCYRWSTSAITTVTFPRGQRRGSVTPLSSPPPPPQSAILQLFSRLSMPHTERLTTILAEETPPWTLEDLHLLVDVIPIRYLERNS